MKTLELSDETYNKFKDQILAEENKVKKKSKKKFQIKNRFTGVVIYENEKTTYKDVLEEAVKNGADLRGANLYEADLYEANLYGANLRGANLREANLYEANLYEADLRGANLYEADLREANLREADLYEANLYEADLREADLRGANLRGADLCEAKFYGKTNTPKILTKKQLPDFLNALGFKLED